MLPSSLRLALASCRRAPTAAPRDARRYVDVAHDINGGILRVRGLDGNDRRQTMASKSAKTKAHSILPSIVWFCDES